MQSPGLQNGSSTIVEAPDPSRRYGEREVAVDALSHVTVASDSAGCFARARAARG